MATDMITKNFVGLSMEPTGDLLKYYQQNPSTFARQFLNVYNAGGITITSDKRFAFVAGRADEVTKFDGGGFNGDGQVGNSRTGFLDQLDNPFYEGGNVGIIINPMGDPNDRDLNKRPRLVAATRPTPYGYPVDVALSQDENYLYVSYQGLPVTNTQGGANGAVMVFNVKNMVANIDAGLNGFPGVVAADAKKFSQIVMLQRGIDDLPGIGNLDIDTHAAYRGQFRQNPNNPFTDPFLQGIDPRISFISGGLEYNFGIFSDEQRPIGLGGRPGGIAMQHGSIPSIKINPCCSTTTTATALPTVRISTRIALTELGNIDETDIARPETPIDFQLSLSHSPDAPTATSDKVLFTLMIDGKPIEETVKLILNPNSSSPTTYTYDKEGFELPTGDYRMILSGKMKSLKFDPEKNSSLEQIHSFAMVAQNQKTRANIRVSGVIVHSLERKESLPIAHTMVKGVDLWDGHLSISSQDVKIPGRGMSLDFIRTYSSAGSSSNSSLGAGWTHNYAVQLIQDGETWTIVGGEGSGNTFVTSKPSYQDEQRTLFNLPSAKFYQPQAGYHTTLVQPDPDKFEFDFYTKSHTRYHFVRDSHHCYILEYIRDPNGNQIDLFYDANDPRANGIAKPLRDAFDSDPSTLDFVQDASNRALLFDYQAIFGAQRIVTITGYDPDGSSLKGLRIEYRYDENQTAAAGNLTSVIRLPNSDTSAPEASKKEKYQYYEGPSSDPHNIHQYTDPSGLTTTYTFGLGIEPTIRLRDVSVPALQKLFMIPEAERILSIKEPGGYTDTGNNGLTTQFIYSGQFTREVTDPRQSEGIDNTKYILDRYGITRTIVGPLGDTTEYEWATRDNPAPDAVTGSIIDGEFISGVDALLLSKTDALGNKTQYKYDRLGNTIEEKIVFSSGSSEFPLLPVQDKHGEQLIKQEVLTKYTYDLLFNKITSRTDSENNTTYFIIDSSASTSVRPEQYDGRSISITGRNTGNQLAVVDSNGLTTQFFYASGTQFGEKNVFDGLYGPGDLISVVDPRGITTTLIRSYDPYGNPKDTIDAVGKQTQQEWDPRGRNTVTRTLGKSETLFTHTVTIYDSLDRKYKETTYEDLFNSPTRETVYLYNDKNQLRAIKNGLGHFTQMIYEAGTNRLQSTTELQVLQENGDRQDIVTEFRYDAGNNLVRKSVTRTQESKWADAESPIIERYTYDALNHRTSTRILQGPSNGTLGQDSVISTLKFDPLGNVRTSEDLYGNLTTHHYDALMRLVDIELPQPNDPRTPSGFAHLRYHYDLVGNTTAKIDSNNHSIRYSYDAAYRLLVTSDDNKDFVVRRYDPGGFLVAETTHHGSETGPVTSETLYDDGVKIADGLGRPRFVKKRINTTDFATTEYTYFDTTNLVEVTDPRKSTTIHQLDGLGRIRSEVVDARHQDVDTPPLALPTSYTYDAIGNLHTVVDPQGHDIDLRNKYDGLGRLISTEYLKAEDESDAPFEKYFYDGSGNLIRFIDKSGIETRMSYDSLNRIIRKTLIESISNNKNALIVAEWVYNDADSSVVELDANRNRTITTYDALRRIRTIENAEGATTESIFDAAGNLIQTEDAKGNQTKYFYDAINRLVSTLEYDHNGQLKSELAADFVDEENRIVTTDRNGVSQVEQKDMLGRVLRVSRSHPSLAQRYQQDQFGVLLRTFEYDGNGNITNSYDANMVRTHFDYDGANRKVTMVEAADFVNEQGVTRYTYDQVGNLETITKVDKRNSGDEVDFTYEYDERYRLIAVVNGKSERTKYGYDSRDNLTSLTDPKGPQYQTTYRYDEFNKLLSVDETLRGGSITSFIYDGNRNKIAQIDANGSLTTYRYNSVNQLTDTYQYLATSLLNEDSVRGSDPRGTAIIGNPIENAGRIVVPYNGNIEQGGTFRSAGNSGAIHWHFDYDENGNQELIVDPSGQQTDREFDWLNRLSLETYSNHSDVDLVNQRLSIDYDYDLNGNLTLVKEYKSSMGVPVAPPQTTTFAYDKLDRLISVENPDGKSIEYWYDEQGNRTSVVDPDALSTNYVYDKRNRVQYATTDRTSYLDTTVSSTNTTSYVYWQDGLLKQITNPNGVSEHYDQVDSYDEAGRLTHVETIDKFGEILSSFEYRYDSNGNREAQIEFHRNAGNGTPQTTEYWYDKLNRLEDVEYPSGATLHYQYDHSGNRLQEVGTDPVDPSREIEREFAFDRLNRLWGVTDTKNPNQSFAYDYDLNGNRIAEYVGNVQIDRDPAGNPIVTVSQVTGYTPYEFNVSDQLVQTVDRQGQLVLMDYSFDGTRTRKSTYAADTGYLYDGTSTLVEYSKSTPELKTTVRYNYGQQLISRANVSATATDQRAHEFFTFDGLGSTSELTNEAGENLITYQYDAWGNTISTIGTSTNSKQFTGHESDPETGLIYAGARYYDPRIGNFTTQDRYLGNPATPPSLNRYTYALNNPLRFVDPTGFKSESAKGGGDNPFANWLLYNTDNPQKKFDEAKAEFDKKLIKAYDMVAAADTEEGRRKLVLEVAEPFDTGVNNLLNSYRDYKKNTGDSAFWGVILVIGDHTGANKLAQGVLGESYEQGIGGKSFSTKKLDTKERLEYISSGGLELIATATSLVGAPTKIKAFSEAAEKLLLSEATEGLKTLGKMAVDTIKDKAMKAAKSIVESAAEEVKGIAQRVADMTAVTRKAAYGNSNEETKHPIRDFVVDKLMGFGKQAVKNQFSDALGMGDSKPFVIGARYTSRSQYNIEYAKFDGSHDDKLFWSLTFTRPETNALTDRHFDWKKLPSTANSLIQAVRNMAKSPEGEGGAGTNPILNGQFSISNPQASDYGWSHAGSSQIFAGHANLSENPDHFSRLYQSFTIPAGTTALRFTVTIADFIPNGTMVPDAFEAAVVHSVTGASLVGPMAGLNNSDALFNQQTDGHTYFSPQVTVTGVANSGDSADVNQPLVVTVNLKNVPAGTPATVYFDLLGFGPSASTVSIDNVQLLGPEGNHAPVPGPFETYSMLQNQTLIRSAANGLLANDTDEENDPLKAILTGSPAHGQLKFQADGSFEYTPAQNYVGQDSFQYRISDGELLSDPVTVSITVQTNATINTPPVIVTAELSLSPLSIREGESAILNAKFTDPDTEPHTVHINWGDGSNPTVIHLLAGIQNIPATQHVYKNNPSTGSTYPITVTVTDVAANAAASTSITVLNSAPTVVLAGSTKADEGQTVHYTFTASDPGKDIINIAATSGGTVGTVSNVLFDSTNGQGSFDVTLSDGTSSTIVSISVTDAEGATSQIATLDVAVNNLAPQATIGNSGPINEGSPVLVSLTNASDASAVDVAAGLHYSFATTFSDLKTSYLDAIEPNSKSFTFADNGSYTVYGRIIDKDGGFTDYESIVLVNNVAPTATMSNSGPITAGSSVTATLTNVFDPSPLDTAAGFRYSIASAPGNLAQTYESASDNNSSTLIIAQPGIYTVYGRVFDRNGGFTDASTTISVTPATPVDVTSLVTFNYYGAQYNSRTKTYSFYGTFKNVSDRPIRGPIQIGWSNLSPSTAKASGNTGKWSDGSPYFDLSGFVGIDGVLQPGETSQPRTFSITVKASTAYSFTTKVRGIPGSAGSGEEIQSELSTPVIVLGQDLQAPESHIASLISQTNSNSILVAWGGADEAYGSGLASFNIYVAVDGGAFSLWLEETQSLSAVLPVQNRRHYDFYSIAKDRNGNQELPPPDIDSTTEVVFLPRHNPASAYDVNDDGLVSPVDALLIISDLIRKGSRDIAAEPFGTPYLDTSSDNVISPLDVLLIIDQLTRNRTNAEGEKTVQRPTWSPIDEVDADEFFGRLDAEGELDIEPGTPAFANSTKSISEGWPVAAPEQGPTVLPRRPISEKGKVDNSANIEPESPSVELDQFNNSVVRKTKKNR